MPLAANRGVVDHQIVDGLVRDAGLATAAGPATRNAREEVHFFVTPAKAEVQGNHWSFWAPDSSFRRNDEGWLTTGVSTLSPVPRR